MQKTLSYIRANTVFLGSKLAFLNVLDERNNSKIIIHVGGNESWFTSSYSNWQSLKWMMLQSGTWKPSVDPQTWPDHMFHHTDPDTDLSGGLKTTQQIIRKVSGESSDSEGRHQSHCGWTWQKPPSRRFWFCSQTAETKSIKHQRSTNKS